MLFQDVVTQTLKRTLPDIARSMPSDVTPMAARLYGELLDNVEGIILSQEDTRNATRMGDASSMLAVKAMLIAVRLARRPAALILPPT